MQNSCSQLTVYLLSKIDFDKVSFLQKYENYVMPLHWIILTGQIEIAQRVLSKCIFQHDENNTKRLLNELWDTNNSIVLEPICFLNKYKDVDLTTEIQGVPLYVFAFVKAQWKLVNHILTYCYNPHVLKNHLFLWQIASSDVPKESTVVKAKKSALKHLKIV